MLHVVEDETHPVKASPVEYRLRFLIHGIIYALGFWSPWNYLLHLDPPGPVAHVWGLLATNLTQLGLSRFCNPFDLVLALAIVFSAAAAWIRTWGAAYIGTNVVNSGSMHTAELRAAGDGILRDGPFGHLRNPLYFGTILHAVALSILMPRSGALFAIAAITLLQFRLIFAEEAFLTHHLGAAYTAYCALVPRMLPSLRRRVAPEGLRPRWPHALFGELYFWIVASAFASAGWRYNTFLLVQCVIVAVGVGVVARALMPRPL